MLTCKFDKVWTLEQGKILKYYKYEYKILEYGILENTHMK